MRPLAPRVTGYLVQREEFAWLVRLGAGAIIGIGVGFAFAHHPYVQVRAHLMGRVAGKRRNQRFHDPRFVRVRQKAQAAVVDAQDRRAAEAHLTRRAQDGAIPAQGHRQVHAMIEQLGKLGSRQGGGKLRGVHHGVVDSLCGQVRYQQQRCIDRLRVGIITHDEDVHAGPLSVFAMMSNHTITRKRIFMSDKLARARHTRSADLAASAASPQTQQAMHQVDNAPGEPRPSQGGAD